MAERTHAPRRVSSPAGFRRRQLLRRLATLSAVGLLLGGLVLADRAGLFGQYQQDDYPRYHGKTFRVIHVVDGDTLDVDVPDGDFSRTRIRLWGVDTPETLKPDTPVRHFGPEATAYARRLAHGKDVRLELLPHRTRGTRGRLLAYVYLPDGRMLNRLLIEEGYGFADPRFPHPKMRKFKQLHARAREERRGLWKDQAEKDLPKYLRN